MKQQLTTLPNGLRVITTEMPDSRSVAASIVVGTGSRYEVFNRNGGVSHFLEHLLFKGTQNFPNAEAISLAIDAVGGISNAYTAEDLTNYYIKVTSRHKKLPLKILADMVSCPLLDSVEIDRERGVIIEEMNVWRDDPARFITTLLPELLFPGNALGYDTFGPEEVIRSITPATIRGYFRSRYRPHNLVVSVAGRVHHDDVAAQVAELLGHLEDEPTASFTPVRAALSDQIVKQYPKATAQAHFLLAGRTYPYGHRSEVVSRVLSTILGAGMSSRLFLNVRERQGLAYTIFSDTFSYVDTGLLEIYAGVNLEKTERALESIWEELESIQQQVVSEGELGKAKEQLSAALEMSVENNLGLAQRAGEQLVLHNRIKTIDETVAEIQSVRADEVQSVACEVLAPERLRLAVIAPDPSGVARRFEQLVTGKR